MKRPIAILAACLVSFTCVANEVRYFTEDELPTAAEIASLLAAPVAEPHLFTGLGGRTRIVRLTDSQESPHRFDRPAPARPSTEPPRPLQVARLSSVGSVAMALRFDVDATRVHAQHLARLDALAAGIKKLPQNAIVTIAGHTDAYGPAMYNIALSLQRALAVRAYLINVHGIPARRLVALGKGKSEPLNRANPYAPENRRVHVHAEYDMA